MRSKLDYRLLEEQDVDNQKCFIDDPLSVAKTHPQQNSRYGMEQKAAAKEFREDVSLLRAFAVLAVLGYHHWPTVFSLGFIGVDIFFVISGFLMIQILEQAENDRFYSITLNFYYRRVKRLVPLYYLIMFMIGFSMMFVYTSIWSKQYFGFYFGAIFFYSNLELLKADGDYFAENTEKLPFLHSWSLGVEMQYYLIAPLLFFISKISISNLKLGHFLLFGCLISSLFFQFNSQPITSFYNPFSRVWQFLCGGFVAMYTEKVKTTITPSHSNILSAILLIITSFIFLPFIPQVAPPSIHQLIITVSSAGYILFGVNSTIPWSSFHLTYISAISYALYLVHYPVLRFAEYLQEYYNAPVYAPPIALALTVLISIPMHHFYEKPLLRVGKLNISLVTLKYILFCLLIGLKWEMVVHPECGQSAAIAENKKFLTSIYPISGGHYVDDGFLKQHPPWGHYVYEGNTGKDLKVVIIGNSWAAQQAHIVREYFPRGNVSEMHLFTQAAYTYPLHTHIDVVQKQIPYLMSFLKKIQPDYVFILARYHRRDLSPFQGENDTVLADYLAGIQNISLYTKKIFLQTHQPFECKGKELLLLNRFLDSLQKGEDLTNFNRAFNRTEYYEGSVFKRMEILFEKCPKCHPIDISESFIDRKRNQLMTFDVKTEFLYFDNGCHLTESGFKMMEKAFRASITNGIRNIKRKKVTYSE